MNSGQNAADARQRVAAATAAIREEVARRDVSESKGVSTAGLERSLTELRRLAVVNAHWGIASNWPVFGRFEVLAKRSLRIILRWYINPLVEQQNSFNLAVLAALYEIEAQLHAISRDSERETDENGRDPHT